MSEDRNERSDRPAMERAEELVDRLSHVAGYFASLAGLRLLKGASLAREEAEDIWAEARSLRDSWRSAEPPEKTRGDAESIDATEAARRRAKELNVDLRNIRGTGADGRITASDVEKQAKARSREGRC